MYQKLFSFSLLIILGIATLAQTTLSKTDQSFDNGESVWMVVKQNRDTVGEFWPVRGLNLVSREHFPNLFQGEISTIQESLRGVATSPDGMSSGSVSYQLEGMSLSSGRPCGDGTIPNFGIVVVNGGFDIKFTHRLEHPGNQFHNLYNTTKNSGGTLFFLPSIYRNGSTLSSSKKIDKVLVNRKTPGGQQVGIIIFKKMVTYDQARDIVLGLDRPGQSTTTHIYVLDGGQSWGQANKKINGQHKTVGSRDPEVITSYMVVY